MSVIEVPAPVVTTATETDDFHHFNNLTSRTSISDMDFVPPELQLPLVIVIGLLGFLAVLGFSKLSAKSDSKLTSNNKKKTVVPSSPAPSTPTTRSSGTPLEQKTGTVMTPAGRRSARIARTRRKED
ncbi:hypothetical protein IV203_034752 [Nitzschia inconspicua]|uniref:Transmembrane protein n=1 Tax=Nitzschia inconspicua TaxID=303405 RepID=A0A9K3K616_9STRA|nr:hypothetical protein IV203_000008 [Nitzschia inconspicua]KAG7359654.1 hypothetical protein IV203_034752 [Nitzschia inconspicua]